MTPELTFGGGAKHSGGTSINDSTRAVACIMTPNRP